MGLGKNIARFLSLLLFKGDYFSSNQFISSIENFFSNPHKSKRMMIIFIAIAPIFFIIFGHIGGDSNKNYGGKMSFQEGLLAHQNKCTSEADKEYLRIYGVLLNRETDLLANDKSTFDIMKEERRLQESYCQKRVLCTFERHGSGDGVRYSMEISDCLEVLVAGDEQK